MQIIPVYRWPEQRAFLDFPWKVYKNDPYWIPQLRIEQSGLVGFRPEPFYIRNECQAFLAVDGKSVLGRICAVLNRGHLDRYNDGVGFCGFFDCIDDVSVAGTLFDAAADWLREKGCTTIRGPVNPSLNHTLGLLIEGFDSSPFFMMTYNPPYYERLFEDNGFRKSQDLYAYWGAVDMLPKITEKLGPICERLLERTGAKLRHADRKHFGRDVETFLQIYNRALMNTWGFVPMADAEIKETVKYLKHMIVPELTSAVELDGKVVGACFALPDYNPRIKAIKGRLFPFGLLRLLWRKRDIKSLRILSTNVLPEYQMQGVGLLLLHTLVPSVMKYGITDAEFSWVLESNSFSRGSLEKGGAIRTKTYRVYDRDVRREEIAADNAPVDVQIG